MEEAGLTTSLFSFLSPALCAMGRGCASSGLVLPNLSAYLLAFAFIADRMSQLQIAICLAPPRPARVNMIKTWPPLLPERGMSELEPVARHGLFAQGTLAGLGIPKLAEQWRIGRRGRNAHGSSGLTTALSLRACSSRPDARDLSPLAGNSSPACAAP